MSQMFKPGQTVYLLYWRRPEERKLTRMQIFISEKGRDNANVDLLRFGLITLTATWEIPDTAKLRKGPGKDRVKNISTAPTCPQCGEPMKILYYGEHESEVVCPNACGSTLYDVISKANIRARNLLRSEED